jgi:hypothetical protein
MANATSGGRGVSTMAVWIEQGDGTIVRGVAESVSKRGARVRLVLPHEFRPDEDVMLRICFTPERPTVGASAQVRWVRREGDAACCLLDWDLGTASLEGQPA